MSTIPKPKHCGQNWLGMNPTEGGRICGQCDRKIIDFSKKSWLEIEQIQKQNNHSVCGMYDPKQLDHWGREIPTPKDRFLKSMAISGLTISMALPVYAQPTTPADSIIIQGKVIDETNGEAIPFASVSLKTNKAQALSDLDGNFKFVLKDILPSPDTLEVYYIGYEKKQVIFKDIRDLNSENSFKDGRINLAIAASDNIIAFYVTKPTPAQRIKWKFKKWFGRKEK